MATITDRDIIKSTDVPAMIASAIEAQLAKFTAFANPSLGYYGVQLKYSMEITTYSRGAEVHMAIKDELLKPEDSAFDPAKPPADSVEKMEVAAGMKMAGRRGPGPKHQPTEGTVVVPALPPVKLQTPTPQRTPPLE